MRFVQVIGFIVFIGAFPVLASAASPASKPTGQASSALPRTQQQLSRKRAEVKRLEQDVARQESDSKRASQRLQKQDEAIAELRKQLQALHGGQNAGRH